MSGRREWIILISLGGVLEVLALWVASTIDLGDGFITFLGGYLSMFLVYVISVHYACSHCRPGKGQLLFVVAVAVALRLPFLFTSPVLSDDIYRYIWDGRVQREGINPYRFPPQAGEIAHLRDSIYEGINNKDIPTIYPPLMQAAYRATTAFSESVVWMKGTFVFVDLILIGILIGLLKTTGMSPMRALIYAWSPLVIVEIAGSGHNDVLALAFLLAAHGAIIHNKDALSIFSLALSGLTKLMGFILAPLFVRSVRTLAWIALPATCFFLSLPYLDAGPDALQGLWAFGARWRANDSLFHLLYALTGSLNIAKAVAASLFAVWIILILIRKVPPLRGCYLAIGAILMLSTTVHPWYVLWIIPFLCFYPNPAWILLTGTVILSYHAAFLSAPGQPWVEHDSIKLLEYAPFFVLLVTSSLLTRRRS